MKTNNLQDFQSLNMCLTDLSSREFSVNRLHEEQHLCRLTMAKVSETMDHLSQALRDQMERHNVTKSKMIEQTGQLQYERTEKDNLTLELKGGHESYINFVLIIHLHKLHTRDIFR